MFCKRCGTQLNDDARFCHACGMKTSTNLNTGWNHGMQPVYVPVNMSPAISAQPSGLAAGSMICGIIAIIACWLIPLAGFVLSVIALVMSGRSRSIGQGGGMSIAGLVLGIISIVFSLISWVFYIAVNGGI